MNLNPAGSGSCQFARIADQLKRVLHLNETEDTCRQIAADWIEATPEVLNFTPSGSGNKLRDSLISVNLETYVENLRKPTTYGDVHTLHALSSVFQFCRRILRPNASFPQRMYMMTLSQ